MFYVVPIQEVKVLHLEHNNISSWEVPVAATKFLTTTLSQTVWKNLVKDLLYHNNQQKNLKTWKGAKSSPFHSKFCGNSEKQDQSIAHIVQ